MTLPEEEMERVEQPMNIVTPYAINRRDDGLLIEWDDRGTLAFYPARALRLACPCAGCVDEMSGRPLLDPATVPETVAPVRASLVGAYGLKITWSDGHSTGIYTFDALDRFRAMSWVGTAAPDA
jgi:ATP-binding protein involved in chromosome partitioning